MFSAPASPNVFQAAAGWVQAVLMGPVATSLAVIAVAGLGLLLLTGRVPARRGAVVILGCFILFGAATLAQGLRELASSGGGAAPDARPVPAPVSVAPPAPAILTAPSPSAAPPDPYAGAAVRR